MAIERLVILQLCCRQRFATERRTNYLSVFSKTREGGRKRERERGRGEGQYLLGGGISRNHVADNGLYVIVPRESTPLTSFELLTFHPLNSSCLWSVAPSATGFNRQRWLSRDAKLPIKVVIKFNGSKGIGDYAIQGTSKA